MKNNQFLSIFMCVVFLFSFNAYVIQAEGGDVKGDKVSVININNIQAKWVDRSDELPGMADSGQITTIAIVGGVLLTGLIVYLVVKKKKNRKQQASLTEKNSNAALALFNNEKPKSLYNELSKASEQSRIQLFAGCNNFNNNSFRNKQPISVGLRIKF